MAEDIHQRLHKRRMQPAEREEPEEPEEHLILSEDSDFDGFDLLS